MHLIYQVALLFGLNLLDALLTIVWVRSGVAEEGNQLMAALLNIGNFPFLSVKVAIGSLAAIVLIRYSHKRVAHWGLTFSLAVYLGLMFIHFFTGLAAFGYVSNTMLDELGRIQQQFFV